MNKIDSAHSALDGLSLAARERLADVVNEAIDQGHLRRADIVRVGKVSQQQAAVDLREIRKRFPDLLEYDPSSRRYVLLKEAVEPTWLDVDGVRYVIHAKSGSPDVDARGIQHGLHDKPPMDLLRALRHSRARRTAGIWWRRWAASFPSRRRRKRASTASTLANCESWSAFS